MNIKARDIREIAEKLGIHLTDTQILSFKDDFNAHLDYVDSLVEDKEEEGGALCQ